MQKNLPLLLSDLRNIQPVGSRYTDWAIPVNDRKINA